MLDHQFQGFRCDELVVFVGVSLDTLLFDTGPAFAYQGLRRSKVTDLGEEERLFERLDLLENLGLPWRAFLQLLNLFVGWFSDDADGFANSKWWIIGSDRFREHGAQNILTRRAIVVSHPCCQLDQVGREDGAIMDQTFEIA